MFFLVVTYWDGNRPLSVRGERGRGVVTLPRRQFVMTPGSQKLQVLNFGSMNKSSLRSVWCKTFTNRVYFGKINKIVVVIYGIILNMGDDVILTLEKIVERQIRVYPHRRVDHVITCTSATLTC